MDNEQELPILAFETSEAWREWLEHHHALSAGIWLRFFKKHSEVGSISYDEALDQALCYGWIDGQLKKFDESSWLRRFTPRRLRSLWSNRNRQHAERLMHSDRMHAAGLDQVEAAKQDGRWNAAYDSPGKMLIPDDFLEELENNQAAKALFETLDKANRYAIAWRLQTAAKPETRQKRLKAIIAMLARGEKFHG